MVEREERARREVTKAKDEEARRALVHARRQIESALRAEMDGARERSSSAERLRRSQEETANRSMQASVARAERNQQEAVKAAVNAACTKLQAQHQVELATLRDAEQRRMNQAKKEAVKHAAALHTKALAAEVMLREAAEAELLVVRAKAKETEAAREAARAAEREVHAAKEELGRMDQRVTDQVRGHDEAPMVS